MLPPRAYAYLTLAKQTRLGGGSNTVRLSAKVSILISSNITMKLIVGKNKIIFIVDLNTL